MASWHLVWVWRDKRGRRNQPRPLSYARSRDLISWEFAAGHGRPLTVPITLSVKATSSTRWRRAAA